MKRMERVTGKRGRRFIRSKVKIAVCRVLLAVETSRAKALMEILREIREM